MRIGSLFSGYGGLDMAVQQVVPTATVAWHCDNNPGAERILAHHWPDIPNLGDVTMVDWAAGVFQAFSEWMMGLPTGHVIGVPGASRPVQLTALGNGVVPQQGAEAFRRLWWLASQVVAP